MEEATEYLIHDFFDRNFHNFFHDSVLVNYFDFFLHYHPFHRKLHTLVHRHTLIYIERESVCVYPAELLK